MKYDHSKIERKWQKKWRADRLYEPDFARAKKPYYNLMMFPYPSAEGLHVGNMYAFVGSDIFGRMKRMQGYEVFEPIGLDGFGIHAENHALKIGMNPMVQAKVSEKRFYAQLDAIGNGFAREESLETYDPAYYKWTQWLFVKMFERGLAYRKEAEVNWCTGCLTVLSDEQAEGGKCERCGSAVEKKRLEQWFFKITDYAERLLANLETLDWSEKVKIAQRNWIGKSEGVNIRSKVKDLGIAFEAFDSVPQTFAAQTFTVIAPEHALVPELVRGTEHEEAVMAFVAKMKKARAARDYDAASAEPEGIFTGRYAEDPFGTGDLPIWVASYAVADYGTGIVHCSSHDERDFAFAKKYSIPLRAVMVPKDPAEAAKVRNLEYAYCRDAQGVMEAPKELAGMGWGAARESAIAHLEKKGWAYRVTTYRLRDWLISRQRYWGPPIPMIRCEKCALRDPSGRGWQPVPEADLPVVLPRVKEFRPTGTGQSPLASAKSFYEVPCPKCGEKARRETDVSDTFLDSSWYFLRYLDPRNEKNAFDAATAEKWLPVDMYIGGAEHAVLHLLYSRFVTMVLKDMGHIGFEEPFAIFRAHGLLIKEGAKMSKSKGNVINPDDYIARFGADTLRTYLMFLAPFSQGGDFRDEAVLGVYRFLGRVWEMVMKIKSEARSMKSEADGGKAEKALNVAIKKVTEDIEALKYNTAISALMICLRELEAHGATTDQAKRFLKLLAPFAPHMAEELWHELGENSSIHRASWPEFDEAAIREDAFDLVVQVNGKTRGTVRADMGIGQAEAESIVRGDALLAKWIGEIAPKRVIFVADRLINFIIG